MTSRISSNNGFNLNNLAPDLKINQILPKPTTETSVSHASQISNPNDALAARNGTNYSAQRFKLEAKLAAQTTNEKQPTFQTIGGSWRIKNNGQINESPAFYRDGEDTAGTVLFDREYYQGKDDNDNDVWIHLNKNGGLSKSPEYKDKARPAGMNDFEWRGWEKVKPENVPADVTSDGKTVAFENTKLAENQLSVLKRYLVDNNLLPNGCDDAKLQNIFGAQVGTEIKIELEEIERAGGKTIYSVRVSDEGMARLRDGLAQYKAEVQTEVAGRVKGQQEETNMLFDVPKVFVRAAIKTVQNAANTIIEIADPSIEIDPHNLTRARIGDIMDSQLPPPRNGTRETTLPRVDAEPVMPEYKSDVMNRDVITGKVNKDGVTVGKVTETAVEVAAPVVIGKVATPARAPETLKSVGALPNKQVPSQDVSRVYRVQGGTAPDKISKHRILIGEKGEMVVNNKETEVLFITFDDVGRVKLYQAKNRPGSEVISFEVDPKLVQKIRDTAIPEAQRKAFPDTPINVDKTKTKSSFGLPPRWIDELIDAAKPGTGRIDK